MPVCQNRCAARLVWSWPVQSGVFNQSVDTLPSKLRQLSPLSWSSGTGCLRAGRFEQNSGGASRQNCEPGNTAAERFTFREEFAKMTPWARPLARATVLSSTETPGVGLTAPAIRRTGVGSDLEARRATGWFSQRCNSADRSVASGDAPIQAIGSPGFIWESGPRVPFVSRVDEVLSDFARGLDFKAAPRTLCATMEGLCAKIIAHMVESCA